MELKVDYKYLGRLPYVNELTKQYSIVEFMVLKISKTAFKIKLLDASDLIFWVEQKNPGVEIIEELGQFIRKSQKTA